jgi:signal peptidase I
MTAEFRARIVVSLVIVAVLVSTLPIIWNANAGFFKTPTPSMYPTLKLGDHITASMNWKKIQRGSLVLFRYPLDETKVYIKRAVAIGGDTVALHDGKLFINGDPVDQQRTEELCEGDCEIWKEAIGSVSYRIALGKNTPKGTVYGRDYGPVKVPENSIFSPWRQS